MNNQLAATAIHEAGHCVAAYKLGIPLSYSKIKPDDTGATMPMRGDFKDWKNIVVTMGGEAAERLIFGVDETEFWRESTDFEVLGDDYDFKYVTSLLERNRHKLLTLAVELLRKRLLRGAEIKAILNRCL